MVGVAQEGGSGGPGAQDAALARPPCGRRRAQVEVEAGVRVDRPEDMGGVISFRAGGAVGGCDHLARGHIEVDDEGQRAVPDVLVFPAFHPIGLRRQAGMGPLQRLDAGHLIRAHGALPCLRSCGRLVPAPGVAERLDLRRRPAAVPLGEEHVVVGVAVERRGDVDQVDACSGHVLAQHIELVAVGEQLVHGLTVWCSAGLTLAPVCGSLDELPG